MNSASTHSAIVPLPSLWSALPPEYAIPDVAPTLAEAQEYCRRLARSHYENFSVASWFLPGHLRQHFFTLGGASARPCTRLGTEPVSEPRYGPPRLFDSAFAGLGAALLLLLAIP